MFLVSSCSCLCPIYWSHVLSWEWRCSWSSADRRCSYYIWVINNFITHKGATYIWDLTVCYYHAIPFHNIKYVFMKYTPSEIVLLKVLQLSYKNIFKLIFSVTVSWILPERSVSQQIWHSTHHSIPFWWKLFWRERICRRPYFCWIINSFNQLSSEVRKT